VAFSERGVVKRVHWIYWARTYIYTLYTGSMASDVSTAFRTFGAHEKIKSNFQGNHSKSLHVSLAASLKKLQTDYIDLLYVHWW